MRLPVLRQPLATCGLLALAWPNIALANAGTALMWAPVMHLVAGNLLLGLGEGLAIAFLLKVRKLPAILVMIAANYASTGAGFLLLPTFAPSLQGALGGRPLLYSLPLYLSMLGGLAFLATILVEWPFCLALVRKRQGAVGRSLGVTVVVHVVSYALLVAFYLGMSSFDLYTNVDVVEDFVSGVRPVADIVYLSPENELRLVALDGTNDRLLLGADQLAAPEQQQLRAEREPSTPDYSIYLGSERIDAISIPAEKWEAPLVEGAGNFGAAAAFPSYTSEWSVRSDYWALSARKGEAYIRIQLAVPTVYWLTRHATLLPGDLIVFQLGEQIVVLDLNTRKLGLLAHGRSPLVLLRRTGSDADFQG